jgi:hypothetical protein
MFNHGGGGGGRGGGQKYSHVRAYSDSDGSSSSDDDDDDDDGGNPKDDFILREIRQQKVGWRRVRVARGCMPRDDDPPLERRTRSSSRRSNPNRCTHAYRVLLHRMLYILFSMRTPVLSS